MSRTTRSRVVRMLGSFSGRLSISIPRPVSSICGFVTCLKTTTALVIIELEHTGTVKKSFWCMIDSCRSRCVTRNHQRPFASGLDILPIYVALNHALRIRLVLLQHDFVTLKYCIGLDKDLPWLCSSQDLGSDLRREPLIHISDAFIQLLSLLQVRGCLVYLQLLQEFSDGRTTMTNDLSAVYLD